MTCSDCGAELRPLTVYCQDEYYCPKCLKVYTAIELAKRKD